MADNGNFFSTPRGRQIIYVCAAVILLLLVFHAGVVAGSRRGFGRSDHMMRAHFFNMRLPEDFIQGGHGAVGIVQNVSGPTFTLQTRDGGSEKVLVATSTILRNQSGDASSSALTSGDFVIVLGTPNPDGSLSAHLIRIAPRPPQ